MKLLHTRNCERLLQFVWRKKIILRDERLMVDKACWLQDSDVY
jgi:hypothetical protein